MTHEDEAEAARRSLMATIAKVLGEEDPPADPPPTSGKLRPKRPSNAAAPAPKPPPALRTAPRPVRPVGEQATGRTPTPDDEGGGPTRYTPPADGLLGGTQRKPKR
jgi:hypothetical protein